MTFRVSSTAGTGWVTLIETPRWAVHSPQRGHCLAAGFRHPGRREISRDPEQSPPVQVHDLSCRRLGYVRPRQDPELAERIASFVVVAVIRTENQGVASH